MQKQIIPIDITISYNNYCSDGDNYRIIYKDKNNNIDINTSVSSITELCDVLDIKNAILVNLHFRGIAYVKDYNTKFQTSQDRNNHLNTKETIIEKKQYNSVDDLIDDLFALEENKSDPFKVFTAIRSNKKFEIKDIESLTKAKQAVSQSNAVNNSASNFIENKQYNSVDDLIALEENKSNPDKVFAAIRSNEKFEIQDIESLEKNKQAVSQSNAVNNSATNAVNNSATTAVNDNASNLSMLWKGLQDFITWLCSHITWVAQKCGIVQSNTQSPSKH
jgi:hypothetical protein